MPYTIAAGFPTNLAITLSNSSCKTDVPVQTNCQCNNTLSQGYNLYLFIYLFIINILKKLNKKKLSGGEKNPNQPIILTRNRTKFVK
jgi:hypothetical protein